MTREEAKSELMQIYMSLSEEKKQALDVLMAQAEKTCDIEKSNFDVRQYKLDTDTAYECGYNAGLQAQADGEYIRRSDVIKAVDKHTIDTSEIVLDEDITVILEELPSVAIPSAEPKKCKDCKWWKDSDGVYRRGVKAESRCPINTVSVANGWGYCYMFELQESEEV